jgi:DNA-binding response OmpR family regulator
LIRVLVIDGTPGSAEAALTHAGYEVCLAPSGREGLRFLDAFRPEVVLLDVGLPDMSGLDVCATIAETADTYILLTSDHLTEELRLTAIELGADDVVVKPFSDEELAARVGAFVRRRERLRRPVLERLRFADVELARPRQELVRDDGATLGLTQLEFRLLWCLAEAEGRLLTRAQILERVWNDSSGVATRVVDVHVAALRKKLRPFAIRLQIASIRGAGYRLDEK